MKSDAQTYYDNLSVVEEHALEQRRIQQIVDNVQLNPAIGCVINPTILVRDAWRAADGVVEFSLKVDYRVKDIESGKEMSLATSIEIPVGLTVAGVVERVRQLLFYIVVHELDEYITYDGKAVFNPHGYPEKEGKVKDMWDALGRSTCSSTRYVTNAPAGNLGFFVKKKRKNTNPLFNTPVRDMTDADFRRALSMKNPSKKKQIGPKVILENPCAEIALRVKEW